MGEGLCHLQELQFKLQRCQVEYDPGWLIACVTALIAAEGGDVAAAAAGAPVSWFLGLADARRAV